MDDILFEEIGDILNVDFDEFPEFTNSIDMECYHKGDLQVNDADQSSCHHGPNPPHQSSSPSECIEQNLEPVRGGIPENAATVSFPGFHPRANDPDAETLDELKGFTIQLEYLSSQPESVTKAVLGARFLARKNCTAKVTFIIAEALEKRSHGFDRLPFISFFHECLQLEQELDTSTHTGTLLTPWIENILPQAIETVLTDSNLSNSVKQMLDVWMEKSILKDGTMQNLMQIVERKAKIVDEHQRSDKTSESCDSLNHSCINKNSGLRRLVEVLFREERIYPAGISPVMVGPSIAKPKVYKC